MTIRTPTYLKSVFESGDIPAGSDYSDIFDSFLPISVTGKQTLDISLEITGNFSAAEIYGDNIYAASALNAMVVNVSQINAQVVSASTANLNKINAQIVSASSGLFNIIECQKVSASAMNVTDVYKVAGTQVVGSQQLAVVQASGGATVDTEARTAINNLITRLRTHGLIAS